MTWTETVKTIRAMPIEDLREEIRVRQDREALARVVYGMQYPDAADTFDHPELKLERNRARQIAWAAIDWMSTRYGGQERTDTRP